MEPEPPPYEFVVDPETDDYHFARHGITLDEVLEVLDSPKLTLRGADETYSMYGQISRRTMDPGNLLGAKPTNPAGNHCLHAGFESAPRPPQTPPEEAMTTRPKRVRLDEHDRAAIRHYAAQTDEEHAREIESAEEAGAWILVPTDLVDEVRALIKEREARKAS